VIGGCSYGINETVLASHHISIPVSGTATARLLAATALIFPVCALAGMARLWPSFPLGTTWHR
jgi:hypothetical protein